MIENNKELYNLKEKERVKQTDKDLKIYWKVMKPIIIERRGRNKLFTLKKLGRIFPHLAIFGKNYPIVELNYLKDLGLIEKIPNDIIRTKDKQLIEGKICSFRISPLGIRYLNEIKLKNITIALFILTLILIFIEVF